MKKTLWTGILAVALIFSLGTTSVLAAETQYLGCPNCYHADGTWGYYVDENGDGICDNFAFGICGSGYGCSTGWQGAFNRCRRLRGFHCLWHIAAGGTWVSCVDADGNGVCDTCGGGYGSTSRQHGCHGGHRR